MFIKYFSSEREAEIFAITVNGKVAINYGWDFVLSVMIKEYVVKY